MTRYFSQYAQDRLLDIALFQGKRGGVFVDVGAHDGLSLSNTAFFERERGWTGLCIEPLPDLYAALTGNRSCTCLNAAISDEEGEQPFYRVSGDSEMLSGLVAAAPDWHVERMERDVAEDGGSIDIVDMKTMRLDRVLHEHGISSIDYLSIDTEGNEPRVLASLDFDAVTVDVIGAEESSDENLREMCAILGPDYELCVHHHADVFFVNRHRPVFARIGAARFWSPIIRAHRRATRLASKVIGGSSRT